MNPNKSLFKKDIYLCRRKKNTTGSSILYIVTIDGIEGIFGDSNFILSPNRFIVWYANKFDTVLEIPKELWRKVLTNWFSKLKNDNDKVKVHDRTSKTLC